MESPEIKNLFFSSETSPGRPLLWVCSHTGKKVIYDEAPLLGCSGGAIVFRASITG